MEPKEVWQDAEGKERRFYNIAEPIAGFRDLARLYQSEAVPGRDHDFVAVLSDQSSVSGETIVFFKCSTDEAIKLFGEALIISGVMKENEAGNLWQEENDEAGNKVRTFDDGTVTEF